MSHNNPSSKTLSLRSLRVGIGHDTHRLALGGPLTIGGVEIPFERHTVGHSDADVLLHAITDAILGAASLGDIGEMFPDTAPENKGRNSGNMLQLALARVQAQGWEIGNLDCIIFAERPKITPHKSQIVARIADLLDIQIDQVNIKAKTGEGLDSVGNLEAIQAQCVALLYASSTPN